MRSIETILTTGTWDETIVSRAIFSVSLTQFFQLGLSIQPVNFTALLFGQMTSITNIVNIKRKSFLFHFLQYVEIRPLNSVFDSKSRIDCKIPHFLANRNMPRTASVLSHTERRALPEEPAPSVFCIGSFRTTCVWKIKKQLFDDVVDRVSLKLPDYLSRNVSTTMRIIDRTQLHNKFLAEQ